MVMTASLLILCLTCFATLVFAGKPQGYLGMVMANVNDSIALEYGLETNEGVLVQSVVKNSPAEKGGLLEGDVILRIAGVKATDLSVVRNVIEAHPNEWLEVEVMREEELLTLQVRPGLKSSQKGGPTVRAFEEEQAGVALEQEGEPDLALTHYIAALDPGNSLDVDFRLRERIIKLVRQSSAPPAVPEEAQGALARATEAQDNARDKSGYLDAMREYSEALRQAPWLAPAYYNIAVLDEVEGYAALAVQNYRLYLLASPDARDAGSVRRKIGILNQGLHGRGTHYGGKWFASWGYSRLGPSTLREWQGSTYDWQYGGVNWKSGPHLALAFSFPMTTNPYGNSFTVDDGIMLGYESNQNLAGTVTRTDNLTHATTSARLAGDAFTTHRILDDDFFRFGYRIVARPAAFEPYLGFSLLGFDFGLLSGSAVPSDRGMTMGLYLGGRPTVGGRVYLGRFFLQMESLIRSTPLLSLSLVSDNTSSGPNISLSPGKASGLSIALGTTW